MSVGGTSGIVHAVFSGTSATLSSDFTSTTTGAATSTGLAISPPNGNFILVHASMTSSISVQGGYLVSIGVSGFISGNSVGWMSSASVSLGADLLTFSLMEFSAVNGQTYTVYFYTLQASTYTAKGGSGLGGTVGCKIEAIVFN